MAGFTEDNVKSTEAGTDNSGIITDTTVNSSTIKSDKVYNIQNLKPYNKTDRVLSSEEAKRRAVKAG